MAQDSEHVKELTDARDRVVAERRQIANGLAQEYKHGHSA